MQVRALVGFAGLVKGELVSHGQGQEFELPLGTDWLRAGLVEVVNVDVSPAVQADAPKPAAKKRTKKES